MWSCSNTIYLGMTCLYHLHPPHSTQIHPFTCQTITVKATPSLWLTTAHPLKKSMMSISGLLTSTTDDLGTSWTSLACGDRREKATRKSGMLFNHFYCFQKTNIIFLGRHTCATYEYKCVAGKKHIYVAVELKNPHQGHLRVPNKPSRSKQYDQYDQQHPCPHWEVCYILRPSCRAVGYNIPHCNNRLGQDDVLFSPSRHLCEGTIACI